MSGLKGLEMEVVGDGRGEKKVSVRSPVGVAGFVDVQTPVRCICCSKQIDPE